MVFKKIEQNDDEELADIEMRKQQIEDKLARLKQLEADKKKYTVEAEEETMKEIKEIAEEQEEKPIKKSAKIKEVIQVVEKLPMQEVRQVTKEDGTIVKFLTIEEALTLFINNAGTE